MYLLTSQSNPNIFNSASIKNSFVLLFLEQGQILENAK